MPSHKSAKKRVRRNDRVRLHNRHYLSTVRTVVKKFMVAVEGLTGNPTGKEAKSKEPKVEVSSADLQGLLVSAQSIIAKAASKGLMKKNTASRKIGRLTNLLTRTQAVVAEGGKEGAKAAAPKKAAGSKKKSTSKAKTTSKKKSSKKKTTKSSK